MGRKKTELPSEYISLEEMLRLTDRAIRDRRSSPLEILKLQRKRERLIEKINQQKLEHSAKDNDSVPDGLTTAQRDYVNTLAGEERESWELICRIENSWSAPEITKDFLSTMTGTELEMWESLFKTERARLDALPAPAWGDGYKRGVL